MFTITLQREVKRGIYETVKSLKLDKFNANVADKAVSIASEKDLRYQFYIDHTDEVPAGYASKKLEYSTVIWKQTIYSPSDALKALGELPF